MEELDFSKPAKKPPPVNLAAALDFFRTSGVAENVDLGTNIFVEHEKGGLHHHGGPGGRHDVRGAGGARRRLTLNRAVFLQLVKTQPGFGVALLAAAAERVRFMASR